MFDQKLSMSGYTVEYIQEKLKKELNPIHLVRSTALKKKQIIYESITVCFARVCIMSMDRKVSRGLVSCYMCVDSLI